MDIRNMLVYNPIKWRFDWDRLNDVQKYILAGFPIIGPEACMKRRITRELNKRKNPTINLWPTDLIIREVYTITANAIQSNFGWPNSNYLPEDLFGALFWDYTGDLVVAEADLELIEKLHLPENSSFIDLAQTDLTYLEVINRVLADQGGLGAVPFDSTNNI